MLIILIARRFPDNLEPTYLITLFKENVKLILSFYRKLENHIEIDDKMKKCVATWKDNGKIAIQHSDENFPSRMMHQHDINNGINISEAKYYLKVHIWNTH